MHKKVGEQTFNFGNPPVIIGAQAVVGPKEGQGPLGSYFDSVIDDPMFGEKSPEKAERHFLLEAGKAALEQAGVEAKNVDFMLAGDLLNQIISASFTARELRIPFLGLYGACSTVVEALGLGAMLVDGGFANYVLAVVSSHYQTAERQYRYPIELNLKHKLTAQYTVTGAGAFVLSANGIGPQVTRVTVGKVVDLGIKDPNDMGSAMAPAAADTLLQHFTDTGMGPEEFDLILTGDLGKVGADLVRALLRENGVELGNNYQDGGILMFGGAAAHGAGGSGCACSAVIAAGYIRKEMGKRFKRVLLVGTGALLSPLTYQQGESVPGVAHALVLEQ